MNWGGTVTGVTLRVVEGGRYRSTTRRKVAKSRPVRRALWVDWMAMIMLGAGAGVAGMLQISTALSGR